MQRAPAGFLIAVLVLLALQPLVPFSVAATSNGAATNSAVLVPNAKIEYVNKQITFTAYGVYVKDEIGFASSANSATVMSYLLLPLPPGPVPQFYDANGYLPATVKGGVANITLLTPLSANESWEVYASYVYSTYDVLTSGFRVRLWLYNATVGNMTVFAFGPALKASGIPSSWNFTDIRGPVHDEMYIAAVNASDGQATIEGYETPLTFLDFSLTFVVVAFLIVDGSLYAELRRRRRREEVKGQAGLGLSAKTVSAVKSAVSELTSIMDGRKATLPKGAEAYERWISSAKARLGSIETRLESLESRERQPSDRRALERALGQVQEISLELSNLFELDTRYLTRRISKDAYQSMEKKRVRELYKLIDKLLSEVIKPRSSKPLTF